MSKKRQKTTSSAQTLKVGITGGIGSGKTTACKLFEELGIPVYYSDERAKQLMVQNKPLVKKIKALFGEAAYLPDGSLDRRFIASKVFENGNLLEKLNAIVHPAVLLDGEKWHDQQLGVPYTLKESAILFDIGSQSRYDKTILVYAPKELRLERAMKRDGVTNAAIEARMAKQMPDEDKMQLADYVLVNDNLDALLPQIRLLHEKLVGLSEALKNRNE